MRRVVWSASLLALVALGRAVWCDEAESLTIKDVMTKAHKPKGLLPALRKELNSEEQDWPTIQKQTQQLITLAKALQKNDPPKGEKDSWEKFSKSYTKDAEALDAVAQKEDRARARAAQAKLSGSCAKCHKAHKG